MKPDDGSIYFAPLDLEVADRPARPEDDPTQLLLPLEETQP